MSIKSGTTEYPLIHPFSYSYKGSSTNASIIVLQEPAIEHIKYYSRLKQMIIRSQMELAKSADEINKMRESVGEVVVDFADKSDKYEQSIEDMHGAIEMCIMAAETVDAAVFLSTFEKMACSHVKKSIAMIDGKTVMTSALWDRLHPDDVMGMAFRWCSFFAMPSAEGTKTTSGQPSESHTEPVVV